MISVVSDVTFVIVSLGRPILNDYVNEKRWFDHSHTPW